MNLTDVTLDIETLSLKPNAVVISISAIVFDPFMINDHFDDNPKLDLLLDINEQESRHIQEETVDWWLKQDKTVQEKLFSLNNRVSVNDALDQLTKFCWLKERVWCQGPTFDMTILQNLYDEYHKCLPVEYWRIRDSRTLLDLIDVNQPIVTHDSLNDCIRQTMGIQQVLKKLNIKKFQRYKK